MKFTKTITSTYSLELDGDELREFFEGVLMDPDAGDMLDPSEADELSVHVRIPGGGDYSNTIIPIADLTFLVEWVDTETSESLE